MSARSRFLANGQRANGLGREPTFTTTPGAFRGTDVRIRFPPPANRMRTRFPGSGLAPAGSDPNEDVRVCSLIVLEQFVWRVSSAAIPARQPQVVAPPDRMP
jgi:hypothetical protein